MEIRTCAAPGCQRELSPTMRADAQFCGPACSMRAYRDRQRKARLRAENPDAAELLDREGYLDVETSLTELYESIDFDTDPDITEYVGRAYPAPWGDPGAPLDDAEDDEDGPIYGDFTPDGPGHDNAFADQMMLSTAIDKIRARYARMMKPYLATQKRNMGSKLPQLAELEHKRDAEINAVVRSHERARQYERAVRQQPYQRAVAEDRRRGQVTLQSFAADLGRGHRSEAPSWSGRDVHSIWSW